MEVKETTNSVANGSKWETLGYTFEQAVLVLGAPVHTDANGRPIPGPDLKERLDLAVSLYNSFGSCPILVSGGAPQSYGSTGAKAEALVMKEYLTESCNVKLEHIILEPTAYHTLDNFIASKAIMYEQNLNPRNLLIVTHDWHMARAKALAEPIFVDTRITLVYRAVVTKIQTQEVLNRMEKEKYLIKNWVPRALHEYRNHPHFPKSALAGDR